MKILDEATVGAVGGGEQWGFLRSSIQLPDVPQQRFPFPVMPDIN